MERLQSFVKSGELVLSCPNCRSTAWGESGLGQRLLHCNNCWTPTPLVEWVTSISSKGDDDPYGCLRLTRLDLKVSVQVDLSKRGSPSCECVRFCVIGGQRSPQTAQVLAEALPVMSKEAEPCETYLTGSGGNLKIARKRGFLDIWVTTEDWTKEEVQGAAIFFEKGDRAIPFLESLIVAMLEDLKCQPVYCV